MKTNRRLKSINGSAASPVLLIVSFLTLLPMLSVSSNDTNTVQMMRNSDQDKFRVMKQNFATAAFATLRSSHACTKNLEAAGVLGVSSIALDNLAFRPHLLMADGSGSLRAEDFTGEDSLKTFLGSLELKRSYLQFVAKKSETTAIYKFKMEFDVSARANVNNTLAIKPTELVMVVELDAYRNVARCQLSKFVDQASTTMEDKICQNLNGPSSVFEMSGNRCL